MGAFMCTGVCELGPAMGGGSCLDACVVNEGVFRAGAEHLEHKIGWQRLHPQKMVELHNVKLIFSHNMNYEINIKAPLIIAARIDSTNG